MRIIRKPAHLLEPGDVLLDLDATIARQLLPGGVSFEPGPRAVVLHSAHAQPGPVGLQLGRLGEIPPHIDRVATVAWDPLALVDTVGHDAPTLEQAQRAAALEQRRTLAEQILQGVERLAAGGYEARVKLREVGPFISAANVHDSVEQAVNKQRAEAWRKLEDERDRLEEERDVLLALVRDGQDTVREYYPGWAGRADELLQRLGYE